MEWLLLLGAGASIASPMRLPSFDPMRDEILRALGWERDPGGAAVYEHPTPIRGRPVPPLRSGRLTRRAAPPEVVFGSLHRFKIPFATQIETRLRDWDPEFSAVHTVAATALAHRWPVWTTNIDLAVERAFGGLPPRVIVGARDEQGERLPVDVHVVGPGTYVKFHGSADAPASLAFTDLELMAPYSADEVQHLATLARGRRLVVYGYAGADTDLRDVFAAAMHEAAEVRWYEPRPSIRRDIEQAFGGGLVRFDPEHLPGDEDAMAVNVAATAERFLAEADDASLLDTASSALRDELLAYRRPEPVGFTFDAPAIVQARLVERFGRNEDEDIVLAAARRADLLRWPPRAVRDHLRWALSRRLYRGRGVVHGIVRAAARHPRPLRHVPGRLSTYVYDKGPAVLLPLGEYQALHDLASEALARPARDAPLQRGSDLYYVAHGLRYLNEPDRARAVLADAAGLLVDRRGRSDAERYAGVLLELGLVAVHQGRIDDALTAARELVSGPGRYAIGRWSGWGHWLSALAHLYSAAVPSATATATASAAADGAVDAAADDIDRAAEDFRESKLERGQGDIFVLRLLARRLRLAAGHDEPAPPTPDGLTRRQAHDVALLLADVAMARDDLVEADRQLTIVEADPANQVAAAWARLGRAELAGRTGVRPTAELAAIEADASAVGAWWLAAQARLGSEGSLEVTLDVAPWPVRARAVGTPRVLWLVS